MRIKLVLPLLFLLIVQSAYGQRRARQTDFVSLINRASAPRIFIDHIVLPADSNRSVMSVIFRFDNDFLPFKKISPSDDFEVPAGKEYYVTARLNSDVFKGKSKQRGNPEVVSRDAWIDTLFTNTFEETESRKLYASGSLSSTLDPGNYYYVLQLSLMGNPNERNSNRRDVVIPDWTKKETGEIYLMADNLSKNNAVQTELPLLNMEDNVPFGKDFFALIRIPDYEPSSEYSIRISKARANPKDTTKANSVYEESIDVNDIQTNVLPQLMDGERPVITLKTTSESFTYALVKIPNTTFENSAYVMEILGNENKVIAKTFFRSYWPDMPASLYNLDVSLDMLKYIVKEEQLKELKTGNAKEKEAKFREFWKSKDPTPNTVYNELMAEYYRRIDYAFKEFGNRGNLNGQDSDQGEIYIKFGPPDSKERQFPTNGEVIEIWQYPNRKFVFKAQ